MRQAPRIRSMLAALLVGAVLWLSGCGDAPAARPNVLLITVDTLRADHLGCYGYARDTSPNLDAFAHESALFERAYSMAPFTAPSHASLFTGMYQISHGVLYWGQKLASNALSYPERFARAGYRTAAFYNHPGMKSCDLERGFEHVEQRYYEPAEDSVDGLLAWIESKPGPPFAGWLHLWDVHRPYGWRDWNMDFLPEKDRPKLGRRELTFAFEETRYGTPTELEVGRGEQFYNVREDRQRKPVAFAGKQRVLDERDWQFIVDRYDGGVHYADAALGRLFAELKRRGLWENTVIVLTSDHGETLRERDACWFTHDPYLYEETLHVPLLVRLPDRLGAGVRRKELVRSIDVLPTLLELADLAATGVQGHSLLPLLRGESLPPAILWARTQTLSAKESDRRVVVEAAQPGRPAKPPEKWLEERECVSDGAWKLVVDRDARTSALFDLVADPGETHNVIHAPEAQPHAQRLQQALDGFGALEKAVQSGVEMDETARKQLEQLGYLGAKKP